MKLLKTILFRITFGLNFVITSPASFGSENAAPVEAPTAPSVVAHFHLSGSLTESPVVDPFGLWSIPSA